MAPLPDRLTQLYRAAATQPAVIDQIFRVLGGTIPIRDLYTARNIAAVLVHNGHAHP